MYNATSHIIRVDLLLGDWQRRE